MSKNQFPGPESISEIYLEHRDAFRNFGKRFLSSDEDILDIYQDSIVILFEHMQAGKLEHLQSSIKTYLFSIGKHLLIDAFKKGKQTTSVPEDPRYMESIGNIETNIILNERQEELLVLVQSLNENCQKILTLYYYREYDMESIAKVLGLKSANVVKSYKSRCMDRIRSLLKNRT